MPLAGIRVLDFTQVLAGPFCAQNLGDMGAEVIKVESPAGDRARAVKNSRSVVSNSFLNVNRNKKSLVADLKHPLGKELIWHLLATVDVMVENYKPGTMEKLGFGYPAVRERFPAMVFCSISGFGQTGPRRGDVAFNQIIQGYSGIMSVTGTGASGPLRVGAPIADLIGGTYATQGILLALLERGKSGLGQWVDVAMLDAVLPMLGFAAWEYLETGAPPGRHGNAHPTLCPSGSFEAADGGFNISITGEVIWQRFCRALGEPGWVDDLRFRENEQRMTHREVLTGLINERLAPHPRTHWIAHFRDAEVPCGPIYALDETFSDPQVAAREMVHAMEHPAAGQINLVANPIKLSRTPARYERLPPDLGADSEAILTGIGYSPQKIAQLREAGVIG